MLKNIDCEYFLELPYRSGSKEHPQSVFGAKVSKIFFLSEKFNFRAIKEANSLHGFVNVMNALVHFQRDMTLYKTKIIIKQN